MLTGSLTWGRATEDERYGVVANPHPNANHHPLSILLTLTLTRYGVVAAFASASCDRYDTVQLSNAFISDRLAVCMA